MNNIVYFPIIRTRDAELRCFRHIDGSDFDKILPIYELTKSRKTKKAPDGDIYKRMMQISEIQGDRPFILDVSTNDKYINPQIEQLLSEQDGFKEWQYFLFDLNSDLNIIPMVHLYEDANGKFENVEEFVKVASRKANHVAVRLPYDLDEQDVQYYLQPIVNNLSDGCKVYVLLDAEFIRNDDVDDIVQTFLEACSGTNMFKNHIESVVMLGTSFPSNVAKTGGDDEAGSFRIFEEDVYQGIIQEFPVKYGDYASINTEQIEMRGGTFVPRIDIASLDGQKFYYKRFRQKDGGYAQCAVSTIQDEKAYKSLGVWADDEIVTAAKDKPSGFSPAFWISVRMNYYIKTRILLRETSLC